MPTDVNFGAVIPGAVIPGAVMPAAVMPTRSKHPSTALIVGGGIGGLTAALCLAAQGWRVELFEQASDFSDIGAGIQISPNAARVLHHVGLAPALARIGFLPEAVQMRAWRSGALLSQTRLGRAAVERFGFPYYHVHRADLVVALAAAAAASPLVRLHTGAQVNEIVGGVENEQRVSLKTAERSFAGDVLIGADGIHSLVRAALFGAEQPRFTGNVAWRGLVPVERLPAGLVRPVAAAWLGPGKHFVHYYVRAGALVNCVCVVEQSDWRSDQRADRQTESWVAPGDHRELQRAFNGWHKTIGTLIDNMNPDSCFRWALFDRDPMPAWSRGCVTLLGDACHPTLPFMAQGAAMAIEDAAVLAACLAGMPAVGDALQRYEGLRHARTAGIQRGSRRNAAVFHMRPPQSWLRNIGMRYAQPRVFEGLYAYDALRAAGTPAAGTPASPQRD